MKHVETEIKINASIEKIWTILMDFDAFPSWNPFIKHISGNTAVGSQLITNIALPGSKAMTFKPKVLVCEAQRELRWKGKLLIDGIFDGEHYFQLEKLSDTESRFIHGELFTGILIPFMGSVLKQTKAGFELMNNAIKEKSEMV